ALGSGTWNAIACGLPPVFSITAVQVAGTRKRIRPSFSAKSVLSCAKAAEQTMPVTSAIAMRFAFTGSLRCGCESGEGKAKPFQRGAVEQARLRGFVETQRGDAAAGFLLAERERIVGAEHDLV